MDAKQHKRLKAMEGKLEGDAHRSAVILGERGGEKGGPARAAALTAEARKRIARKGAKARWG